MLTEKSFAALRAQDNPNVLALPEICIEFLHHYSWMSAAINNSRNPHKAATTTLNRNAAEFDKWLTRRAAAQVVKNTSQLSDEIKQLLEEHDKTIHPQGGSRDNDFKPEDFHAGHNHPDCQE